MLENVAENLAPKERKLLTKNNFDLVLMDIQMPEMDGLTATKKIREGGMDGYVSKPVIRKELEEAIARIVPA